MKQITEEIISQGKGTIQALICFLEKVNIDENIQRLIIKYLTAYQNLLQSEQNKQNIKKTSEDKIPRLKTSSNQLKISHNNKKITLPKLTTNLQSRNSTTIVTKIKMKQKQSEIAAVAFKKTTIQQNANKVKNKIELNQCSNDNEFMQLKKTNANNKGNHQILKRLRTQFQRHIELVGQVNSRLNKLQQRNKLIKLDLNVENDKISQSKAKKQTINEINQLSHSQSISLEGQQNAITKEVQQKAKCYEAVTDIPFAQKQDHSYQIVIKYMSKNDGLEENNDILSLRSQLREREMQLQSLWLLIYSSKAQL